MALRRLTSQRWFRTVATIGVLATAGTIAAASPAQAADTIRQYYLNGGSVPCMDSNGAGARVAQSKECNTGNNQKWRVQTIAQTETSRELVHLRNVGSDFCLDSYGTGEQDVRMVRCNGGNNQKWEVHRNGNSRIFKSWGAWKGASNHKCVRANYITGNSKLRMEECDVNAVSQQWKPNS